MGYSDSCHHSLGLPKKACQEMVVEAASVFRLGPETGTVSLPPHWTGQADPRPVQVQGEKT